MQSIKALGQFPVALVDIIIITNTADADEVGAIRELCAPILSHQAELSYAMKTLEVRSFPDLNDPWHLPWCHKPIISSTFIVHPTAYTHYLNIEDDIEFSYANFLYFLRFRGPLEKAGLIPSFIRVEYNYEHCNLYCTDQFNITKTWNRRSVIFDGLQFMNIENPHIAMLILDQSLAAEYVTTPSFDQERSKDVHTWGVCERASMGLCFENVPKGFYVRYVVPVDAVRLSVPSDAFVFHTANNYTNNPSHPHGKIRVDSLFSRDGSP